MVAIERKYKVGERASSQSRWLAYHLNRKNMSCTALSKLIRVSKQTVLNWLEGSAKMPYCAVYTICGVLSLPDDPNVIWKDMKGE